MPELYPLLLKPEFHERVWGSRDLSPIYNYKVDDRAGKPVGEVWLTGDSNQVANGPLAGSTLNELCDRFGPELVGDAAATAARFPLLIKFLFPREKLSVQVHPDDEGARRIGQPCGKTECWYVLAARPKAQVGLGLKPGTTREQVERAIHEKRLEFLLNWIEVFPGEMVYVDAGTVHAIGPGSVLVETQQNSDTTYRLYDYGRPRELHLEQGLAAIKERTHAGKVEPNGSDGVKNLVTSPCFAVDRFAINEPRQFGAPEGKQSAKVFIGLEGCGVVEADGLPPVTFSRGEAVVVPACIRQFRIRPQWQLECLRAMVPGVAVSQPVTRMDSAATATRF